VIEDDPARRLTDALSTEALGRPLRHYPIALTTEALALAWARQEEGPEGATVVADQEVAPRQRKGPPWVPFAGRGLYFSIVLRPSLQPDAEGLLWLLASLAAAEGLSDVLRSEVSIKWPDDLLVGDRKIGGVKVVSQLGPAQIVSAILTFRVNLDVQADDLPPELQGVATSARMQTGETVPRERALDAILRRLEQRYDDDLQHLLEDYRRRCETLGRQVRALLLPRGEIVGRAGAVDQGGSLVIEVGTTKKPVPVGILKKLETINPRS